MGLAVLAFTASMVTVIVTIVIWPGEATLVAPLVCPDDQPDGIVVYDTYSVRPGETSTNFTLYCVGPRGQSTDAGFFVPFLLLTGFHAVLLVVLGLVLVALSRLRRRRRPAEDPAGGEPVSSEAPRAAPHASSLGETDVEPPGPIIS